MEQISVGEREDELKLSASRIADEIALRIVHEIPYPSAKDPVKYPRQYLLEQLIEELKERV